MPVARVIRSKHVEKFFIRLGNGWDPLDVGYKRLILLISYIPFFLVSLVMITFLSFRLVSGNLSGIVLLVIFSGLALFLGIGVLFYFKKEYIASILLIIGIIILGILMLSFWGLIHPIGFLLCLIGMRLAFALLNHSQAEVISITTLLSLLILGILHLTEVVPYNFTWIPRLNSFDFLIILILFSLFVAIAWINSIGLTRNLNKVRKMKDKLKSTNVRLQKEVVLKTKEIISSKSRLSKSYTTLRKAYQLLEGSEKDRFTKMNLLGHYGLLMSSVIHGMANPLMLAMAEIENTNFPRKKRVMKALNDVAESVRSVRANIRVKGRKEEANLRQLVKDSVDLLRWKLEKNQVKVNIPLTGTEIQIKHNVAEFREVLLNLLTNAIDAAKEIPNGYLSVTWMEKRSKDIVTIENGGTMIKKKDRKKIFNIFYSTKKEGNGIGLYIAREYARKLFDGDVRLLSSTRHKTIFEFSFAKDQMPI